MEGRNVPRVTKALSTKSTKTHDGRTSSYSPSNISNYRGRLQWYCSSHRRLTIPEHTYFTQIHRDNVVTSWLLLYLHFRHIDLHPSQLVFILTRWEPSMAGGPSITDIHLGHNLNIRSVYVQVNWRCEKAARLWKADNFRPPEKINTPTGCMNWTYLLPISHNSWSCNE